MRSPDADAWFAGFGHPTEDDMKRAREIILSDDRIWETITGDLRGWRGDALDRSVRPASLPLPVP